MIALLFWLFSLSIIYTYIGYPFLLGLFARLRPPKTAYPPYEPFITLLIAAYNEESIITQKLENSLLLDYPREKLQIIVAADGSNDKTVDLVKQFVDRGVELSYSPERRGKMVAINRAMEFARGDVVVFSDANNMYESETLKLLSAPFVDKEVGAVSGAKSILKGDGALGDSEGAYWKYESWIKKQETRLGCTTGVSGEVWAIRRALFERPPAAIINDDFYMAMRIIKKGYRMVYVPEARSIERISLTAQDEVTRRTRIVAGRYQAISLAGELVPFNWPLVAWQVISHKFMRPLVPLGMIGVFVCNALLIIWEPFAGNFAFLRLASPWNLIFMGLQLAFYLLAGIGSMLPSRHKLSRLFYLPTFLVNSNLAALYGLLRYMRGGQSTLWTKVRRSE
jgi:cellulose synthase/poly-beta-1,6-N-acetylglucosamine synthase-like glycosyltransferase